MKPNWTFASLIPFAAARLTYLQVLVQIVWIPVVHVESRHRFHRHERMRAPPMPMLPVAIEVTDFG